MRATLRDSQPVRWQPYTGSWQTKQFDFSRSPQTRSLDSSNQVTNLPSPQPGPQETFLQSEADIVIFGGAAGGGKTWALLMQPLKHMGNPLFGGVIFRRTSPQIRNQGGLWDESTQIYPLLNAEPRQTVL